MSAVGADTVRAAHLDWQPMASPSVEAIASRIRTTPGLNALRVFREAADGFGNAFEEELQALQSLQGAEHDLDVAPSDDNDMTSLRRRIGELRHQERSRAASELLHLNVLHRFHRSGIPLLPPLEDADNGGTFGHVDPKMLVVGLYSDSAVEMVRHHVMHVIGEWDHLSRDFPLQLSLFQVAQVYAGSALYGYALRRADLRYQLERALRSSSSASASASRAGGRASDPRPAPAEERACDLSSLAAYVGGLGPEEANDVAAVASWEAEEVLERHVGAIFGDMRKLQSELLEALRITPREHASLDEDASVKERLQQAIAERRVASIQLSVSDLRRVALEGCAFGTLLSAAEAETDSAYDLSAAPDHFASTFVSGDLDAGLTFSAFKMFGS